jgi:hypothetical protein
MRAGRFVILIAAVLVASSARADDDDVTVRARTEFLHGTDAVGRAQWAEALGAFERSASIKPHAITTYNIGACERALGRYTRARRALRNALSENDAAQGAQLASSLVAEAKGWLAQIDKLLASVDVTLDPPTSTIAVDGRPLEAAPDHTLVAGLRLPGPAEAAPSARFTVVLDPGVHVITLSRKGYSDSIVNRTFVPGATTSLVLALDRLPTTFHVDADQANAIVRFANMDIGAVPIDVSRPAGVYRVQVNKSGFVPYEATVTGSPGELVNLRAKLAVSHPSIFTRWWFWAAAGVVVAGAATATYFLVRQPPPPNGGGLGWSVPIPP